jgi:hypothetical protein
MQMVQGGPCVDSAGLLDGRAADVVRARVDFNALVTWNNLQASTL